MFVMMEIIPIGNLASLTLLHCGNIFVMILIIASGFIIVCIIYVVIAITTAIVIIGIVIVITLLGMMPCRSCQE